MGAGLSTHSKYRFQTGRWAESGVVGPDTCLSVLASRTCADVGGCVRQVDNAEVRSSPISGPRRNPLTRG